MTEAVLQRRDSSDHKPVRVLFLYWGRRGLTQFALELARTALFTPEISASISVSRQNERFHEFQEFGAALFPVDTFASNSGMLLAAWRIPLLRSRLRHRLRADRTEVIIELMPHVWSPFVLSVARAEGVRYVTFVHDAEEHPGDYRTNVAKRLLDMPMHQADTVQTLSAAVSARLVESKRLPGDKVQTLFHPDLHYGESAVRQPPQPNEPFRLLWMGRIMAYKGLTLFLDAVDLLRGRGHDFQVGVFGEGALGASAQRLSMIGAEVINRWLSEAEIAAILPRFHALVLSHTEASQSGIAAMAFGAGLPVIATPVGGLVEQISAEGTGVLAAGVDASGLADAVQRLMLDRHMYSEICQRIAASCHRRSMLRFVSESISHAASGSAAQV
jgi:glycosyltransferase involved in cell wall biosynthesis